MKIFAVSDRRPAERRSPFRLAGRRAETDDNEENPDGLSDAVQTGKKKEMTGKFREIQQSKGFDFQKTGNMPMYVDEALKSSNTADENFLNDLLKITPDAGTKITQMFRTRNI